MKTSRIALPISSACLRIVAAAASVLLLPTPADGQETTRVSVDSSGAEANFDCGWPSISAEGQFVAFDSLAWNLVANDNNAAQDVFVHDRETGITERVSLDASGAEANSGSYHASISVDGQFVAFSSYAYNLIAGDSNGHADVFVKDRATGVIRRASVDSSGAEADFDCDWPSISADGQQVAFWSYATNLVAGDTNAGPDVFVHDFATGVTERVSVDSSGAEGNDYSFYPLAISADGNVVSFWSYASNLVPHDKNSTSDVFVHDRATGITERVSVDSSGKQGNLSSIAWSISADGQIVAFYSGATNLVAGDTNGRSDAFVHDRATGITERVSVSSSGAEGNATSESPSISGDGRIVSFVSLASNLVAGDTNRLLDVFVHDRATGITDRASVNSSGAQGNDGSYMASMSAHGRFVAFFSSATNLVSGDTNGFGDVFVHEQCSIAASWTNYGSGFPGTNGIPSLTPQQNPTFGATITLTLDNSYGAPTAGLLVIGYQRDSVITNRGGELLVVPTVVEPITFWYGADTFTGTIPSEVDLCGVVVDLQGIEFDPGAALGVSFSPGLELVIGN